MKDRSSARADHRGEGRVEALACRHRITVSGWVGVLPRKTGRGAAGRQAAMSLPRQPPAPLAEYSQLCKTSKPDDGFSDAFARTGTPKEFGGSAFEWQRTEGKLNEIGLPLRPDGPGKTPGFTDEDKLCFFEGKLEKEQRENEAPCQPASGHLEKRMPPPSSSEKNRSGESPGIFGLAGWQTEPAGGLKGSPMPEPKRGITDQEKAGEPKSGEVDGKGDPKIPDESPSRSKEPEIRAWNPTFPPLLPEAARLKNGGSPVEIFKDGSRRSGLGSAPKVGPPTTTVELAQDDGKGGGSSFSEREEEVRFLSELEEKLDAAALESGFLSRGGTQRKAMRRAMSECSHLSVPPALHLADKYPEPVSVPERDSSPSILPPTIAPSRKPSGPMKRSATVSDEQASSTRRPGGDRAAPLCPVLNEPVLPAEDQKENEQDEGGVPFKREPGTPGSFHPKLELIPETSDGKKGERDGRAAKESEGVRLSGVMPAAETGRRSPRLGPEAPSGVLGVPSARPGGEKPEDSKLLAVVVVFFSHGKPFCLENRQTDGRTAPSVRRERRRTIETRGFGRLGKGRGGLPKAPPRVPRL